MPPRKPTLAGLQGDFSLHPAFRKKVNIHDGILYEEVRNWKDLQNLVDSFFENCKDASAYLYKDFIQLHYETIQIILDISERDLAGDMSKRHIKFLKEFTAKFQVYLMDPAVDEHLEKIFKEKGEQMVPEISEKAKGKKPISLFPTPNKDNDCQEFSKLYFELPENRQRYKVNDFDVSKRFHKFQVSLTSRTEKLLAETHVHQILAMSSILLLKPGRMNPELVEVFGTENLNLIMEDMDKLFGLNKKYLPMRIIAKVIKVIESVQKKKMTTNQAIIRLLSMEEDLDKNSFKVIKSVANILARIPKVAIMEPAKETELSTRYLEPLLCGLFDDPKGDKFFRCTDETAKEAKNAKVDFSKKRPDIVINFLDGVKWKENQGFGEVKCLNQSENNHGISKDLIRLGMFSKKSIDTYSMNGVLTLQAVGNSIIFYLTVHMHDHLYIMYEIAEITAPRCLDDLLKYLMDYNKLLSIVELSEKWCNSQVSSDSDISHSSVISPDMGDFYTFVSATVDRSRPCITKHEYR